MKKRNVRYEKWSTNEKLKDDANDEDVINLYKQDVERIKKEFKLNHTKIIICLASNYNSKKKKEIVAWIILLFSIDVCQVTPISNIDKKLFREKFLQEHTHDEEEVRFFVDGGACFYLHLEDEVIRIVCSKGHLLIVATKIQ